MTTILEGDPVTASTRKRTSKKEAKKKEKDKKQTKIKSRPSPNKSSEALSPAKRLEDTAEQEDGPHQNKPS